MAFMNQERKKTIEFKVKPIMAKYGMKGRLGVRHHSTLVLNVAEGPIDFAGSRVFSEYEKTHNLDKEACTHIQVNTYHIASHFSGKAQKFLLEVYAAMMGGNHDRSDSQSDYFDVGWYVDINIGKWDHPYVHTES